MNEKPKDFRPKIISYPMELQGLNIASIEDILWPCHAYTISLPKKKQKHLNILEETILKLTEADFGNTDRLAYTTGLDKELVIFIQNRLIHLGLIDKNHNLTAFGKNMLEDWDDEEMTAMDYTVATVFVDLLSGKMIPFITTDALSFKRIIDISKDRVMFQIDPQNTNKWEKAYQIMPIRDSYWNNVPDNVEIIKAIREYKRKFRRYAILSNTEHQHPQSIPKAEAITLNDDPELVYLHCKALIQKGNSDLIVTDGVGLGFSEQFAKYITEQSMKWVLDMKKKGIVEYYTDDGTEFSYVDKAIYPEVSKRIKKYRNSLVKLEQMSMTTTSEEENYRKEENRFISAVYAAVEWAFRITLSEYPVDHWENLYSQYSYRENEKILQDFAKSVGFHMTGEAKSLLKVNSGAIRQISLGKVELQPLLALLISGAMEYAGHPFNSIAAEDPDFLTEMFILKRLRDPIEHGDIGNQKNDIKQLKMIDTYITEIILTLLPRVADDIGNMETKKISYYDPNQERLKARTSLDELLGQNFVLRLPVNLNEQLIRGEIFLQKYSADNTLEIIKCFYSSLQLTFLELTQNRRYEEASIEPFMALIQQKIIDSGFFTSIELVPPEITTVNPQRIYAALEGRGSSLGAQLLAFIAFSSEGELNHVLKTSPMIIDLTARLINLRGHGNTENESVSYDTLLELRRNLYALIKNLMEAY